MRPNEKSVITVTSHFLVGGGMLPIHTAFVPPSAEIPELS